MDEAFTVAFNDVDFCLRVRKAGWRVVWTPYAQLYHYESKSRGLDEKDPAKKARFEGERARLYRVLRAGEHPPRPLLQPQPHPGPGGFQ